MREFLAQRISRILLDDDRLSLIWKHLQQINSYSTQQKYRLIFMFSNDNQIENRISTYFINDAIKIDRHLNTDQQLTDEETMLISSINFIIDQMPYAKFNEKIIKKKSLKKYDEREYNEFNSNSNLLINLKAKLLSMMLLTLSFNSHISTIIVNELAQIFIMFYKCFSHNQEIIKRNLYTILNLCQGHGHFQRTKIIVESDYLMRQIFQHIEWQSTEMQSCALNIIFNITKGFEENIPRLLHLNLLNSIRCCFLQQSNQFHFDLTEKILLILDNISGNHSNDIQAIIDANLVQPIFNISNINDTTLMRIVLNILLNITQIGSISQMITLLKLNLLKILSDQLDIIADSDIIEVSEKRNLFNLIFIKCMMHFFPFFSIFR